MSGCVGDWTDAEQQRLELGLMQAAGICDTKTKWQSIAAVVQTRDARSCAERFKDCRKIALCDKENAGQDAHTSSTTGDRGGWQTWRGSETWWGGSRSSWSKDQGHDSSRRDDWWSAQGWDRGWHATEDNVDEEGFWPSVDQDQGHAEEQQEEETVPLSEVERRKMEMRREVEANLERNRRREEQRQKEETSRAAKQKQEEEARALERRLKLEAREQEVAQAREKAQAWTSQPVVKRSPAEAVAKSSSACAAAESAVSGPVASRGWAVKAGMSKAELARKRKDEMLRKQTEEVMQNLRTMKKGMDVETLEAEDRGGESSEEEEGEANTAEKVVLPSHGCGGGQVAVQPRRTAATVRQEATSQNFVVNCQRSKKRWWSKIDGDCPISLAPLGELPQPPFALMAEGSKRPHYFDAQFLANFLVSTADFIDPVNRQPLVRQQCVELDAHLRRFHPDEAHCSVTDAFDLFEQRGHKGDDRMQFEATAVLQHLFSFRSSRRSDERGRAVHYSGGGLTVVNDDEVVPSAPRISRPAPVDEGEAFPVLGNGGAVSSAGWSNPSNAGVPKATVNKSPAAFPGLPTSPKRPPAAKEKPLKPKAKGGGHIKQSLHSGPKAWGPAR